MSNYFIIGSDGKQYGPVSGEDLRQWISEGRINGQSQAVPEGGTAWQPISTYPEFADLFASGAAPTAPAPFSSGEREAARGMVKGPAIALIITGGLGALYYGLSGVFTLFTGGMMFHQDLPPDIPPQVKAFIQGAQGPMAGIMNLAIAAINGFVLFGAIKMLKLSGHGLAVTTAIVAMLPCLGCCCLLGLPFGIWALVVLNKTEVKSQFD